MKNTLDYCYLYRLCVSSRVMSSTLNGYVVDYYLLLRNDQFFLNSIECIPHFDRLALSLSLLFPTTTTRTHDATAEREVVGKLFLFSTTTATYLFLLICPIINNIN